MTSSLPSPQLVIDGHARVGNCRDTSQTVDQLVERMDRLGITTTLIAPEERCYAVANGEGNDTTIAAARSSRGRLRAYMVANPWLGHGARYEMERTRDAGAIGLSVDPIIQGFDLHDGLIRPLLDLLEPWNWLVYVRTGTPPSALPLPLAALARQYPSVTFIMGRSGAPDFHVDVLPALRYAPNLLADTAYAHWDIVLEGLSSDAEVGAARAVFTADTPYAIADVELSRVLDWPISAAARDLVLGQTLQNRLAAI